MLHIKKNFDSPVRHYPLSAHFLNFFVDLKSHFALVAAEAFPSRVLNRTPTLLHSVGQLMSFVQFLTGRDNVA